MFSQRNILFFQGTFCFLKRNISELGASFDFDGHFLPIVRYKMVVYWSYILELSNVWSLYQGFRASETRRDSVYKPDGTLTETADEPLEIMEKSHFKDGDPPAHKNTNTSPDKHLSQIIYSESRMQEAISSFVPLKAAGPDTLQPLTIQKAWHHIHKTVRNIMIKSHEMQHVPGSWTESNGIFLLKPGKTDYNKPNSYRTITLSPTLLKLQEKVILRVVHKNQK